MLGRERMSGTSCGRAIGAARALAERSGVLARAAGERGGRGSKGAACWRGADVEGHRLAQQEQDITHRVFFDAYLKMK